MTIPDCTILVLSCDKYSDLWNPFFKLFKKYWQDCPFPVVLGSNTVVFPDKKIHTILSGQDKDWSTSLRSILKQIKTTYVFLWLDDIFPIETINSKLFSESLDFMKRNKAKHVHIEPKPTANGGVTENNYTVIARGAPYRATAFGFWEASYLYNLLIPGETPWNFEIMGSYRASYSDGFYIAMEPSFRRIHLVEKGQFFKDAYGYCKTHAIDLSQSHRKVLSNTVYLKSELQKIFFNTIIKIPWNIRLKTMNMLRKLLISY